VLDEKAQEEKLQASYAVIDRALVLLPELTKLSPGRVLFVVDGMRPELYDPETLKQAESSYFALMRNYLILHAKAKGFSVLDLQPAFIDHYAKHKQHFEFEDDGHWNELGHKSALMKLTKANGLEDCCR